MRILCDMDGVLTDMVGRVCKKLDYIGNITHYDMRELGGWELALLQAGAHCDEFWQNLPVYPHILALTDMLDTFDPDWHICTTPYHGMTAGKLAWIKAFLPSRASRVIFTSNKHAFMEHQTDQVILVDDCDENIRHGLDVVFPQPWNTRREISWFSPCEKVEYVRMAIQTRMGNVSI